MEARALTILCTFLFCCFGVGCSFTTSLNMSSAVRDISVHHSRYPPYMMQLYRTFRTADSSPSVGVSTVANNPSTHRSDSVLSLTAKGCQQVGERWTVTFDMSSISTSDLVQLAELRIRLPAFSASKNATVDLYHSQKQNCEWGSASCPEEPLFLGSLGTSPDSIRSTWKVFNVTALLKYWLYQGDGALSKEALGQPEAEHGSGAENEGEAPGSFLPKSFKQRQAKMSHPTTNRVTMVIFSRHNLPQQGQAAYSLIHTVENSKYVNEDRLSSDGQSRRHKRNRLERMRVTDGAAPSAAPAPEPLQGPLCRRVDMWVDFDHIGWDEWIVHPKRYNAYRCEGECPIPLDESFSPTNHAYMQSLLRHYHPERVSCPSCVPTRLSPISMLYYENDDLTLRHHEDMIVEECGCH
ncbi:southpaw [Betta splendens]|uniref:Southpaw n=1 Tax=Betta splendens TaxID=158456 RepID=A0A6P7NJ63_BETSP|nr:southpaw [Betta splendens]